MTDWGEKEWETFLKGGEARHMVRRRKRYDTNMLYGLAVALLIVVLILLLV